VDITNVTKDAEDMKGRRTSLSIFYTPFPSRPRWPYYLPFHIPLLSRPCFPRLHFRIRSCNHQPRNRRRTRMSVCRCLLIMYNLNATLYSLVHSPWSENLSVPTRGPISTCSLDASPSACQTIQFGSGDLSPAPLYKDSKLHWTKRHMTLRVHSLARH
jgi:hypothetical protein